MQAAADGASPADDAAASQHLREHAERSGRAFGSERLSVRLIDYEVIPQNCLGFRVVSIPTPLNPKRSACHSACLEWSHDEVRGNMPSHLAQLSKPGFPEVRIVTNAGDAFGWV